MGDDNPNSTIPDVIAKLSEKLSSRESFVLAIFLALVLGGFLFGVPSADNPLKLIAFLVLVLLALFVIMRITRGIITSLDPNVTKPSADQNSISSDVVTSPPKDKQESEVFEVLPRLC